MSKTYQSGPFSLVRDGDSVSCRMFGAEVDRVALADLPADGVVRLPLAAPATVFENDRPVEITHFHIDLTDAARADLLTVEGGTAADAAPAPKRRGRRPTTTA